MIILISNFCLCASAPKDGGLAGFVDFVYKHIVPSCFMGPLKPTFDLNDAQTILALNECAMCLKTVAEKRVSLTQMSEELKYHPLIFL